MEKQHAASLSASARFINEEKKNQSLRFGLAEADLQAVADLIKLIFSEAHDM